MSSTPQPPIVLINPYGASREQPPPVLNYPIPNTAAANHVSRSSGNFLTVFAVLAVIAVISAVACLLGWLCNKRKLRQDGAKQKHTHAGSSNFHPQTMLRQDGEKHKHAHAGPSDFHPQSMLRQGGEKHKHAHASPSNFHPQTSRHRENDLEFGFEGHLPREMGTEFGFEKRMPNVQESGKEDPIKGYKPFANGESKDEGNTHFHIKPRSRTG